MNTLFQLTFIFRQFNFKTFQFISGKIGVRFFFKYKKKKYTQNEIECNAFKNLIKQKQIHI